MVGLAAMGFEALSSTASSLAAVRFKQHQENLPNAVEPTSAIKIVECNAATPNVGEVAGLSGGVSGRHDNLLILRIN